MSPSDGRQPYRILSLDGGGIRGLLTAVILEQLGLRVGVDWIEKADLIAGTSSGGMIALALAKGLTPADARSLFYDRGPIMFEDSFFDDLLDLGGLRGAEFSTENRRRVLEDIFGDDQLGDYSQNVLISTIDLHDPDKGCWKAKFFHNFEPLPSPSKERNPDREACAFEVALYTSAAPTYFPSVGRFVDGGLIANNPSMAALAQALDTDFNPLAKEKDFLKHVVLLSVGAGRTRDRVEGDGDYDWGYLQWGKHLVNLVSMGLLDVAHYQCSKILKDPQDGPHGNQQDDSLHERYHRINYDFPEFEDVGLVEYEKRDQLVEIGERRMDEALREAATWLDKWWTHDPFPGESRRREEESRSTRFIPWWCR